MDTEDPLNSKQLWQTSCNANYLYENRPRSRESRRLVFVDSDYFPKLSQLSLAPTNAVRGIRRTKYSPSERSANISLNTTATKGCVLSLRFFIIPPYHHTTQGLSLPVNWLTRATELATLWTLYSVSVFIQAISSTQKIRPPRPQGRRH